MTYPTPPHAAYRPHKAPAGTTVPPLVIPAAIALALLNSTSPNPLLALLSATVLVAGSVLLWRPGESPVLLFTFAFPWVQGSISIFHANWLGLDIGDYATNTGDIPSAVVLSLLGILAMAVGMRLGAGPRRPDLAYAAQSLAMAYPASRWLGLYAAAAAVGFVAMTFAWAMPGLTQPLLALANMRWAFFFMLAYAYFTCTHQRRGLFPLVFLLELATGIGAYFADFRLVFIVTLTAALASGIKISARAIMGSGALAVLTVVFAVVWTAVKGEFRSFVSGGQAAQIITVDYTTRLAKLYELVTDLGSDALSEAANQLLRRLTYVEFFSVVLINVPASIPHTLGAILWDAIIRPFMPRLLFVDKEVIDDTARTNLYTNGLAGNSEGTSISLGYVAEAYIDFGPYAMFPVLLLIGMFYGSIYRFFIRWRRSYGLYGMAIATTVLMSVGPLENSFTKVFGGVIVSLVVAWVLIFPRWLPWLVPDRR
jgi:hypothetical protein